MPKVLVAEDEAVLRQLLCETLLDHGFEVLEAPNGEAAWKLILTETIDLLLSDIQMPAINGIKLSEMAVAASPETKIVLMSGYSTAGVPDWLKSRQIPVLSYPCGEGRLAPADGVAMLCS